MKSVDFPAANLPLAEDQPEYETLYVRVERDDPYYPMTSCIQFTPEEIAEFVKTGKIWITQATMGKGYHPMSVHITPPFDNPATDTVPADANRTSVADWDKTHYPWPLCDMGPCPNCGKQEGEHFWSKRQCEI